MYSYVHSPHKKLIAVIALGILLAWCSSAFALDPSLDVNQYAHTAWKVHEGFAKGEISSIAQTPDGYIWLGTQFGLRRFDGVRNVPWEPPGDQHLPSSYIFSLLASRDGTLWIGTWNGLASWKDGRLTQYPELAGHYIFNLLEDRDGVIWIGGMRTEPAMGKLCAIRKGGVHCNGGDGGLGRGVFGLYEDSKDNLWVGVPNGVWRWNPGPPKFYSLPNEPDGIQALGEDADGTLLVGGNDGIYRLVDAKVEKYPLLRVAPEFRAKRILRDRDGGLWIGTSGHGLVHIHQGRTDVFAQSDGLSGDVVKALFEDREGNIWITTINGLDRFRDFAVTTLNVNQGLSSALVLSVLADRDRSIWLSTRSGLDRWKNGQISTYDKREGKLNGLAPGSLFQDDSGRIWVSTLRQFGYLESDRSNSIKAVPGGNVLSMAQDRAGNLWVANEALGLFRLSPRSEVRQIPWAALGHKDHASVLASDPSQGGLWIGFFQGGIAYFENDQVRASYTTANGLGEGRVSSLQFDHEGTLWASTAGGLSRLKNSRVTTLTSKNGLPCDKVHWVMEDDDHSFWLYMSCGLVRIERAEMNVWATAVDKNKDAKPRIQTTVFDSADGVRGLFESGHFSPQVAKSSDGKLWFLPWDGVSVIDPRHLSFNKLPPPVHIEQITADHTQYDVTSTANGILPLPALARELEIDYTALSLAVPEKVLFRYKLEGFDPEWQEAGTRRQAFYTNLPPRHYRFRVMACNNSGVWNEAGATLDFSIAPAYYQATWFRALCVVVFLGLLWSAYQLRRRQLQQQFNMRLETRVNERTRIARELHDTLLQSFHGLMFRFQAARNMLPGRPEEAGQTLDGALTRAEQAIAEGRSAIQDLRSAAGAQADLAQALTAAGQELARQDQDHGSPLFQVVVEGERRNLSRAFQEEVYRMGRELLQNAFQHARAREVEAEVRYEPRMFRLLIRDDGKGIDANVLEQGGRPGHWGLPGIRERAEQIGAEVDFWSEAGAGTEIQLTVPAGIAYEKSRNDSGSGFRLFRKRSHERHS